MRLAAAATSVAVAAAFALAFPAPGRAADDARVDVRVEAFFAACLTGFRDPAQRAEAVGRAGFRPAADDAHPMLARLMVRARREAVEMTAEKYPNRMDVYSRGAVSDALYVVTNEVDQPPDNTSFRIDLMGCRLYHFGAGKPLDGAPVARRLVQPPAETIEEPGRLYTQKWASGVLEGVWELSHSFIGADTPEAAKTGFSGVYLHVLSTKKSASAKPE